MLPKTKRHEWHEVIFAFLIETKVWSRPQSIKGLKRERIIELHEAGMIEQRVNKNTRAAPAKEYRITEAGKEYYTQLTSQKLFNPNTISELCNYMIAGDHRALFPYLFNFLNNETISSESKDTVLKACLATNNGYLYTVAKLHMNAKSLNWMTTVQLGDSWGNDGTINARLSQVGVDGLQAIQSRLDELGLRKHATGKKAADSFAVELAIFIAASVLDELL
jgi:hypothetical protein